MRPFGGFLIAVFVLLALPKDASAFPSIVPLPDETPIEENGNAQSDLLLDCYAKFAGLNLGADGIGVPRITRADNGTYLLRADFTETSENKSSATVNRLLCWIGGFQTQKTVQDAPLYPPGTVKADMATESAIAGWRERKQAAQHAAMTARRLPPPDAATKAVLEGIWLIGDPPDKGDCLGHWYHQPQIEFEFRKSGGRALLFEPPDLFTPIQISGAEKTGDTLVLQAEGRDGGLHDFLRIRQLAKDHFELLPQAASTSQIAYRCGDANASVTSNVPLKRLSIIAPPVSGGTSLLAEIPGISDDDLCQGQNLPAKTAMGERSLQFEIYGPVHYWVLGWNFPREDKLVYAFVRSIDDRGKDGLVLHMQEHLEKGEGWDVTASRGTTYDLTIIPHGDRIEIPELSTTFVRCSPRDKRGAGMGRL